ncbi:MAG: molecular chaperone HtpG [Saprospiraceae bacterium]|jgi:molecular chaperone HtpG|nr:molecular chaperone HtpG [Saprospiraceae bacterium]
MSTHKGSISVQTENIFPIIKKFLYSDQEIFLRELISNAIDATTKLKVLSSKGECKGELGELTIEISVNKKAKTITISDKGIGMTRDEVEKYLNQVAFSSAQEFIDKYKEDANIIGHFGLGFYSAFMVANKVDVKTLSYKENSEAIQWSCEGEPEYTIDKIKKTKRGTDIILHISPDAEEYLEDSKIQSLLDKYCRFLPVEIKFGKKKTYLPDESDEKKSKEIEVDNIVNNPNPLWKKQPADLTDEDYKAFYNELYPYSQPPLFWIHLNIDYPFNLTGVLYFPKINNAMEVQKNKIQLYSNQVYVTDDVKEIVPEFLTLLHGIIDSPDIPLNVSRSYLQSDHNVKKITGYITRKVAEKLQQIFDNQRPEFEDKWNDIGTFIKYGMITDEKFAEKAVNFCLLKNVNNVYHTIESYKEHIKANQTDKNNKLVVLYTNNAIEHDAYISSAKAKSYDVLVLDQVLDNHFIQQLEYKNTDLRFVRVDADTVDKLIEKDEKLESVLSSEEIEKLVSSFKSVLRDEHAEITTAALSPDDQPATITKPEFMRRMKEMQAMQGMSFGNFPDSFNLVINTNHPIYSQKLLKMEGDSQKELTNYLYDLALLNQNMLKGSELTKFISKTINLL